MLKQAEKLKKVQIGMFNLMSQNYTIVNEIWSKFKRKAICRP